jgi:hypothetical protein
MSVLDRGMLRQSRSGLPDHIRLDRGNECGAVYQASLTSGVKDVAGAGIDSDYVARDIRALVLGRPDPQRKGQCRADAIANPDNLSFIPEAGTLLIAEDTRRHPNALVWAYRLAGRELAPIAAVPAGAEATALSWYQGINGFAYILLVAQHVPASGGQPGYSELGYIGPISGFASPEGR